MSRSDLAFRCVRSEGGLLPPDLLRRVAAGDKTLAGLGPEHYHLLSEKIGEATSRAWQQLLVAWRSFRDACAKLPDNDLATTVTRERWLLPLFAQLGYGRLARTSAIEVEGRSFAISHAYAHSPIHLLGARVGLDDREKGVAGAARMSPHGLLQDLLNRSDAHLWAFVSNGLMLRILRDHHSLASQAFVEFDLETMLDGEHYSEFVLLWLVCHQSRVEGDTAEACWLEKWFATARDEGVRALDKLRKGVEDAIAALGTGFLKHPANRRLRQSLEEGTLDKQEYYRELLRLVYRLIFVFVAEDRGLLLDPSDTDAAKLARVRYERFYSTRRLRDLASRHRGGAQGDLWIQLRRVLGELYDGCPTLGLPALGSFLFSPRAVAHIDGTSLANEHLLAALRALCLLQDGKRRFPVAWRNVGAEELGSVYESLLELHPRVDHGAGTFTLDTAAGHERKTTGSYYTPSSLVECLLDTALDPVLDEAAKKPTCEEAKRAILDLKVCDPACGSGHFLVAAGRRIARRLAQAQSGDDEPSPRDVQHALREVIGRCLYGVDINPMAVELCKVALWMEAVEPGKPLSFLEGHVQHGNALLGATPELMANGIPSEAFEPIEGDDKKRASRLKKRNKQERAGQETLFARFGEGSPETQALPRELIAADAAPDDDITALHRKESRWSELTASRAFVSAWFKADAWCAAFVWPKASDQDEDGAITHGTFVRLQRDPSSASAFARDTVRSIARQHAFLHWRLAFPQVFGTGTKGGFDVVLGNPPWERVKLAEKEWFAERRPDIARAENAAVRGRMIAKVREEDPALWREWVEALREANGQSHLLHVAGRFPLCGRGDINTYAVFAELDRSLVSATGRVGCVVPTGIALDDGTKDFFQAIVDGGQLCSLFDFQSGPGLFAEVGHARFKFALVTLAATAPEATTADLLFFARSVAELATLERHIRLSATDLALLNPNTRTCPTFRGRRDARINHAIYQRVGVLWNEGTNRNPWGAQFMVMLHMANDSNLFASFDAARRRDGEDPDRVPLYEAKMVHHFDHRYGDYADRPEGSENTSLPDVSAERLADPAYAPRARWYVPKVEVDARLAGKWSRGWLLGWRDICRSTDERTVIASVIPRVGVGHKFPLLFTSSTPARAACLFASLCSFAFDYCARQKLGGTSLTYFIVKQFPVLSPDTYDGVSPWSPTHVLESWLLSRVLELAFTAWDLASFGRDCGYDGPPFRWDPARRSLLRAELDAAFFYLYAIARDDVDYILDTFPIVRDHDVDAHGEYRTKRVILERYDAMTEAARTGKAYETVLDPPPADPRVAHDESTRPDWARPGR